MNSPHSSPPPRPRCWVAGLVLLFAACALPSGPGEVGPQPDHSAVEVLVLGTAQDAGLPQVGCDAPCCGRVRRDPSARRLVTSVLIGDRRSGRRWLLDATPDLPRQIELARGFPPGRPAPDRPAPDPAGPRTPGPRPPFVEGIFLTHAHVGHYTGLIQLGREAYDARAVPVHGTASMAAFLGKNEPWRSLVENGNVELRVLEPGVPLELAPDLSITALRVPHRDELSDTVAFRVDGPRRSLLYLPDIDKWPMWERRLEDVLAEVDVALLDGAFFADGEIPGRSMADIPHPFVSETLERLAPLPATERAKVHFTHLNHTNPAADPTSPAAAAVRRAGMSVAREGMIFGL